MLVNVDEFLCRVWDGEVMYTPHVNWGQGLFLEIGESRWDLVDHIRGNVIAGSVSGGVALRCTGMKDKNGRLIYKGDIIKVHHFVDYTGCDRYMYKEVVWRESTAQWYFKSQGKEHNQLYVLLKNTNCEVVGNIYENKGLLEVEDASN